MNLLSNCAQKFRLRYGRDKSPFLGIAFTLPVILMMTFLLFIPMGYQVWLSLFNTSLKNPQPVFIGLKGYIEMFQDPMTGKVLTNSLVWTVAVTGFQFLLGFWTALTVNQKFFGRTFIRGLTILPWIIPGTVAAMVWKLMYDAQLGFLNKILRDLHLTEGYTDWLGTPGLAMTAVIIAAVWKGFGFSALMYMAGLQGVSQELHEAAEVDGATVIQRFFHVTLPSMKNVITTTLILTSIWTFNYFEIIYVMTGGGPLKSTHIAPTYIYEMAFRNYNMGDSSRFAVLSMILVGIASVIYVERVMKEER